MKKILKCVGSIALAVCIALVSIIIPMKLSKKQSFLGTSLNNASATVNPPSVIPPDFTYPLDITFSGSDMFYALIPHRSSNTLVTDFSNYFVSSGGSVTPEALVMNVSFGLQIGTDNFYLVYSAVRTFEYYIVSSTGNKPNSNLVLPNYVSLPSFSVSSLNANFISNSVYRSYTVTPMQYYFIGSSYRYVNFGFEIYKDNTNIAEFVSPTLEMVSIEMLNSYQFESKFGYAPAYSNSNIIRYTDTAGYSYIIYIPCVTNADDTTSLPWHYYYYTYRKYLLPAFFDLSDNSIYQQGVSDGYASGVPDGYNQGYSKGLAQGNTEGFNEGYIEGLNTSNEFTFNSLISSVIDVPVRTFTSLFDFDLLGVNLAGFFYALLTFCAVIVIFKIALGGK